MSSLVPQSKPSLLSLWWQRAPFLVVLASLGLMVMGMS